MVQLNPVSFFGEKKNTSTIWRKFFTEMSVQMVSSLGVISQKATLHVQHTSFVHFFAVVRMQRETSRNFLVTRFMKEMSYVFSFPFFLLPLIFTLHWCRWPLAFLILSPLLQNFHVVLPTKKFLLCFLSLALDLCRPFSRWASLACRLLSLFLCLSLALYSKFVDMTINLSLIL